MFTKRLSWLPAVVTLFLLCTGATVLAAPPGKCSQATLKGAFGIIEQGTILVDFGSPFPSVPYQGVVEGLANYDGAGNLTVTYTASFGGLVFPGTATGTYVVNPDCTYSDAIPATDAHRQGTITGEGMSQEIHTMFTDSWVVGSGTRRKTPVGQCSLATLKGPYGIIEQGTILLDFGPPFPSVPYQGVVAGLANYDGAGNLTVTYNASFGGLVLPGTATGTYVVNPDCTYSDVIPATDTHRQGTITGEGMSQEIHTMFTDSWIVGFGTRKKTSGGATTGDR
jgi:hypothetical protein